MKKSLRQFALWQTENRSNGSFFLFYRGRVIKFYFFENGKLDSESGWSCMLDELLSIGDDAIVMVSV